MPATVDLDSQPLSYRVYMTIFEAFGEIMPVEPDPETFQCIKYRPNYT